MRIVILVDNSQTPLEPLPQIRRGLQQFVNALPPNHELMLVTTGGKMNIRVQPTRDYLEVYEAIGEINFMRSSGNALIGSVQEVFDRYLRTVERRFPMIVIVSTDGVDFSQRVTDKSVNEMLQGLTKSGRARQRRSAHLDRHQPHPQHHARDDQTHGRRLRVGHDRDGAAGPNEGDGRPHRRAIQEGLARQGADAGIQEARTPEIKRAARLSPAAPQSTNLPIYQSSNS